MRLAVPTDLPPPSPELPGALATSNRDLTLRHAASEELGTARCPICRAPLSYRWTCRGPAFRCLCDERR
jgi:hypothetical protein